LNSTILIKSCFISAGQLPSFSGYFLIFGSADRGLNYGHLSRMAIKFGMKRHHTVLITTATHYFC